MTKQKTSILLSILTGRLSNPSKKHRSLSGNIILDNFSDCSYVSLATANILGLHAYENRPIKVTSFHGTKQESYPVTNVLIESPNGPININCFITDTIPTIDITNWKKIANNSFPQLTFPQLENGNSFQPDILIGMEYINSIRKTEIIKSGQLEARNSILGYYIEGASKHNEESHTFTTLTTLKSYNYKEKTFFDEYVDNKVDQFFDSRDFTEQEDYDPSKEDLLSVLNKGTKKVQIETGETLYEVPMLWKKGYKRLKPNFNLCLSFLHSMTDRLIKNNNYEKFNEIIQRDIKSGTYEIIKTEPNKGHHIPTFAAFNPNSTSTPLRIVLAANLPAGNCINSELETGPSLINNLNMLLRKFRVGKIGIVGDINKAFNRLLIREEDRDYFKFLWWSNDGIKKEIITLRLRRVAFGTNLAPFQWLGTLNLHLTSHPNQEVSCSIIDNFYSDNLVISRDEKCTKFVLDAVKLLADGGLHLCKFSTNCKELKEDLIKHELWNSKEETHTRVLGMIWSLNDDTLSFPNLSKFEVRTRREALKSLMRTYDPIGLLTCLIMPLTNLYSSFCENYSYDEPMKQEDIQNWMSLYNELELASKVIINRHHNIDPNKPVGLHVFTDATGNGWGGACAYLTQNKKAFLVAAKGKLPAKTLRKSKKELSVPRRELIAAAIGAKLVRTLIQTYKDNYKLEPHMYSDSQIILNWILNAGKVDNFVDNRVRLIREQIVPMKVPLHFIDTENNPADWVSRGMTAKEYLDKDHLFWTGPAEMHGPLEPFKPEQLEETDIKKGIVLNTITQDIDSSSILNLLSDCRTLLEAKKRISSLIQIARKAQNLPALSPNKLAGEATRKIIKGEQEKFYKQEIDYLDSKSGPCPTNVKNMSLFLDKFRILRVGGRLTHASIGWAQKFPILISRDSPLLPLRIQEMHETMKHGGPGLTKTALQQLYWIPRAGKIIPKVISKCYKCRKATGPPLRPPAPPALPPERATLDPMSAIGVDLTGHFNVKGPNNQVEKVYLAFFTCCSTRYINIELIDNMTTECFLQAFRRHCSRFAIPRRIWSDNATNFVRGSDVLGQKLGNEFLTEIGESMNQRGIDWKFNIVSAPWQGGHFERLIGVVKALLKRVCGRQMLPRDELWTLSKECQSIVNERPYGINPTNHKDRTVLTPNLVVFGRSLNPLPYGDNEITEEDEDPTYVPNETELDHHWRRQASRMAKFREQFSEEYFSELRKRQIYDSKIDPSQEANINISKGDLVILQSDIKKRALWDLAEVIDVIKSESDGKIRGAHLKTKEGTTTRPLQKIYPLLDADQLRPNQTGEKEDARPSSISPQIISPPPNPVATRPRRNAAIKADANILAQAQSGHT